MKNIPIRLLIFVFCLSVTISACSKKTRQDADEAWTKKEFSKASDIYKGVFRDIPKEERGEIAFKIAEGYKNYNNYKNALRWYKRAEKEKYGPDAILMQAEMQKRMQNYADAIILFNQYLKDEPNNSDAKTGLKGAELALKWMESGECVLFKVENVKKLNSNGADYCAYPLKKEGLVFTSDRDGGISNKTYGWTGDGYHDLYFATFKKRRGSISINRPELLKGTANTKYNDGASTIDKRGSKMYYTQCGGPEGKYYTCQIYNSNKKGRDNWDDPIMLSFCDTSYNYGHPSLSLDGSTLYFSSDMPGGFGGKDIWMVKYVKRGKTWGDPINLGPTVNTAMDEMYPSIAPDGQTLYFSSNGHVGMGGLDMFKTQGTGDEWSEPENLKYPLNSGGDDFSLTYKYQNNQSGYFTSNRDGGRGGDDIWEFFPVPQEFKISGVVKDCKTGLPVKNAGIFISNDKDSNKIVLRTDKNGFYTMPLLQDVSYELYADKNEDFYTGSMQAIQSTKNLICSKDLVQNFEMCRLDLERMFNVRGILYDLDKAFIRPDAAKILDDSVVSLLRRFPSVTIELGSHTDCRASADYNRDLAQRRADSAVAYILSKGIDSARLTAKGYGEDSLYIKKCKCELSDTRNICSEFEHQLNRRTTVKITRVDYFTDEEKQRREALLEAERQQREKMQKENAPAPKVDPNEERKRRLEERQKLREQKLQERKRKAEERKKKAEEKRKAREEKMRKQREEREKKRKNK